MIQLRLAGILEKSIIPYKGCAQKIEFLCVMHRRSDFCVPKVKSSEFFSTVLLKGQVLGEVIHYFWKKEYQSRGAPHYHIILWIRDAPFIGVDPEDKVTEWIDKRITCHIPDEKTSPELDRLVTKYQLHKCSSYCRCKKKYGSAYYSLRVWISMKLF